MTIIINFFLPAMTTIGLFLLIYVFIKEYKTNSWMLKIGIILIILGNSSFIISFFQGLTQGIMS